MKSNLPIGVFDSGVGGFTVLKELIQLLPNESFIYLGDTLRVPYGVRTKEEITKFSLELEDFLLDQNIKALVVACNTISATCLSEIKERAKSVPVIDVIYPTVRKALDQTKGSIGVLATDATVRSNAYKDLITRLSPTVKFSQVAATKLVPQIEKGILDGPDMEKTVREYLNELPFEDIDTLILGSTHYPIIKDLIVKIVGEKVSVIDSANPTSEALEEVLVADGLKSERKNGENKYFVTGDASRAQEVADVFFGNKFPGVIDEAKLNFPEA